MTKRIELAADIKQDEPLAWLVFMNSPYHMDYKVFADQCDARACADDQAAEYYDEHGIEKMWQIYPLYAGQPMGADPNP